MKKALLFFGSLAYLICNCPLMTQSPCQDTWPVCDSVTIDSISIWERSRIYFHVHSEHQNLYAPNFIYCANATEALVEDSTHFLFSLLGPISTTVSYHFQDSIPAIFGFQGQLIVDNNNNSHATCRIDFDASVGAVGIAEELLIDEVQLYPNPTTGDVFLKLKGKTGTTKMSVHNLLGEELSRQVLTEINKGVISLPEPFGIYIVRVEIDGAFRSIKVVKAE